MTNITEGIKQVGVFVIHALKGYEYHEKRIVELFKQKNIDFEFVTDGDASLLNDKIIGQYFSPDIQSKLSLGVTSCTLNHIHAYEKMVQRNMRYAIVLENDPFFLTHFDKKLQRTFDQIKQLEPGFIVSLENSTLTFPSFSQTRKGKYLYRAASGRMAGAYLIDLTAAKNILNDLKNNKCHTVIDWWHNSLIERNIIRMYWVHPPLFEQGSHNGHLSSTISSKASSSKRRIAWNLQKVYKMYFRRLFKQKQIISE
ncbi:MAG: glycosyltransferase family 25 protein [Bacteroidales bacterium]|nr:glycosyltransferase family 25 protein [Bacteroidales bacterium]